MIILELYEDAHEKPSAHVKADSKEEAVLRAAEMAENLATDPGGLKVAEAGSDELFEIYPEHGYGTVVVKEMDE